jgi:hypothetical protein
MLRNIVGAVSPLPRAIQILQDRGIGSLAKQALSQLSYGPKSTQYTPYTADFHSAAPVVAVTLGLLG